MTGRSPGVTFGVLATGVAAYSLLQSTSVPTLPDIQAEYGASQATASWILTAFLISASISTPILGRMGNVYGKKWMFVFVVALLGVGSLVAALAPTIEVVIVARAIQGLGAGTVPLALGILRDEMPPRRLAGTLAFTASLLAVGYAFGIVVAGPIVEHLGLHWLFLLPMLVGLASAVGAVILVPASPPADAARIPVVSGVLFAGWLVPLLVAVTNGPHWGWGSPASITLISVTVVAAVAWVIAELRLQTPMIDLRLMRVRGVWASNLVAFFIGAALFCATGFFPQFVQTPTSSGYGFGVSVSTAGQMMLPLALSTFMWGVLGAPLAQRVGVRTPLVLGPSLAACGALLAVILHDQPWHIYLATGVIGLGTGLCVSTLPNAVIGSVHRSQTALATGVNANLRTVGGAVGVALATTLVTSTGVRTGLPQEHGYIAVFLLIAVCAACAGVAGAFLPRSTGMSPPAGLGV